MAVLYHIFSHHSFLQGWPDELPLIINGTLGTGKDGTTEYGWQLDIPVVMFGFCFCVIVLLILVQVIVLYRPAQVHHDNNMHTNIRIELEV